MPSFRRRASVMDAGSVAQPTQRDAERSTDDALTLAEEAEAEAAEAEAVAAAARARARAIRLRKQATESPADETTDEASDDADEAPADEAVSAESDVDATEKPDATEDGGAAEDTEPTTGKSRRLRMPRIRWGLVAAGVAIILTTLFVAASGYLVWQHRLAEQEQERRAEYQAAARQSVVTLMSLDFNNAQEDVQRIIDNSTGQFKEDFEAQAEAFAQVARDSKVVTEVTVNVAAVKSMTDTGATALVSATSRVTNSAGANQEPRSWRLLVDLAKEGDQIKMAKVEFVP